MVLGGFVLNDRSHDAKSIALHGQLSVEMAQSQNKKKLKHQLLIQTTRTHWLKYQPVFR